MKKPTGSGKRTVFPGITPIERRKVFSSMALSRAKPDIGLLERGLKHTTASVRISAVKALRNLTGKNATLLLKKAAKDPHSSVQAIAVEELEKRTRR